MILLVALRVSIGAMFFAGSVDKLHNRNFSSAGFLRQAKGPLAPFYRSSLPDVHGWETLVAQPQRHEKNPFAKQLESLPRGSEASKTVQKQWNEAAARSYAQCLPRIVQDWGSYLQAVAGHYQFTDEQKVAAAKHLSHYEGKLTAYLLETHEDLEGYRHDLYRATMRRAEPEIKPDPYVAKRSGEALAVRDWVEQTSREYELALDALATPEQRKLHHDLPHEATSLDTIDTVVIWTHCAIGICLIAGLLTRLAAFGGGLFLLSVVASQPPWVEGAQAWMTGPGAVMYQCVMMLVCFTLMFTSVGRWAGLDFLIHHCVMRPLFGAKETPERS